jgi:hypothetical protein
MTIIRIGGAAPTTVILQPELASSVRQADTSVTCPHRHKAAIAHAEGRSICRACGAVL